MKLIKIAINRPTAVLMFLLAILFTGILSLMQLPLELVPDVDYPKISVNTVWSNSSPEMVEAYITSPIEAIANTVTNVHKVSSSSTEGNSSVTIELLRGTNTDFAALELNERLSLIREKLPPGTQPPQITKYVPREFQTDDFLSFNVVGSFTPSELRQIALRKLRGPLLAVEGVADVQLFGGQEPEIRIEIDEQKLKLFAIPTGQLWSIVRNLNIHRSAGKINQGDRKFELVIRESVQSVRDIERLVIANKGDHPIRISDVGRVFRTYSDPRNFSRIDGKSAILLQIEKEAGTNTIGAADRVFDKLNQLSTALPASIELIKQQDQSERIRKDLTQLSYRAGFCVLIIFLVLLFFLRQFQAPIIILSSIFFSVLLTINFFYFAKIGLNLMTLAGLSLGFGMLVDNSIVVLDNIHRKRQNGLGAQDAAFQGTSEVALAIIAATLTSVVAFIPFLYLTGELRLYYFPFVSAVGLSLLSSLLAAFTLMPALARKILEAAPAVSTNQISNKRRFAFIRQFALNAYQNYLRWAIRRKFIILLATLVCFGGSYYLFDKNVTKGSIWSFGGDTYIRIFVRMPSGAELERTDKIARSFEEKLLTSENYPNIKKIFTRVSREYARITVTFPDSFQFTAIPLIIKEEMIAYAVQFAGVNVSVYGFGPGFYGGGGGSAPHFRLKVLGYNYNEVKRIAVDIGRKLKRYSRIRDVNVSSTGWGWRDDLFEMVLKLDREKASDFKLTHLEILNHVQRHLRENLGGNRIRIGDEELDYRIKFAGFDRFTLDDLKNLLLTSPEGEQVRLSQIAEIGERKVMSRIDREDQQYQRWVTFEYRGPYKLGDRLVESLIKNTHLPPGYKLDRGRWRFMKEEEKQEIYFVLALSLLLVYMVTAALFESLKQPFIIILTVPMALIGIFLIFYFTDSAFDRSAYIGVILLGGIVVNNAIIMVDHINLRFANGCSLMDAVLTGASDRVRPILMTTATTVFGLLPLVLFAPEGQSMWFSLALSAIGGLLSSMVLVLTVIPLLYYAVGRKKANFGDYAC